MTVARRDGRPISDHAHQQAAKGAPVDRSSGTRWQSDPVDQEVIPDFPMGATCTLLLISHIVMPRLLQYESFLR
jgi:hypothetical protein